MEKKELLIGTLYLDETFLIVGTAHSFLIVGVAHSLEAFVPF